MSDRSLSVRCCIVGGGPAGVMLGYLLARAGHSVAVLEKHGDFLRDFRGDTVHPSTMTMLDELGLLDDFLKRPHSEVAKLQGHVGNDTITLADFSAIKAKTQFLAFMPQWDFLNFLSERGSAYPGFKLLMKTEAVAPVMDGHRVVGVKARDAEGELTIQADVVAATDGRSSTMRSALGITPTKFGAPMDVLWMRISRKATDTQSALGYIGAGSFFVTINRDTYWQCGYVIPKGTLEGIQARGIDELRRDIVVAAPFLADRIDEIATWDDVKLLSVAVDRLEQWYRPGILFIGDAAHAMSPIGGVGINLAIQDAVATANILHPALAARGAVGDLVLRSVQTRREPPTKKTQGIQLFIQSNVITRVLAMKEPPTHAPFPMNVLSGIPFLRRLVARTIGIGFLAEHVSPEIRQGSAP